MKEKLIHISGLTDDSRLIDYAVLSSGAIALSLGLIAAIIA